MMRLFPIHIITPMVQQPARVIDRYNMIPFLEEDENNNKHEREYDSGSMYLS
jgi:hypothetical protein